MILLKREWERIQIDSLKFDKKLGLDVVKKRDVKINMYIIISFMFISKSSYWCEFILDISY